MGTETREPLLVFTAAVAVVGLGLALFGVYWDDAWHTDRGRDEFLSPPHISLYVGVALVVVVVIWWARPSRERPTSGGPVGLAVGGAVFTLASAPIDEWWHESFGRDAVLWSPPHLAALAGTIALATGVALIASTRLGPGPLIGTVAGAGVVGAWQVLVMEYDTDVAQFSPLWYLPVMAVALSAAALTVHASQVRRVRWPASWAGIVYTLAMIGVALCLKVAGFSTPIVPLVLPALVVADLGRRNDWAVGRRVAGFVGTLFGSYWFYLGVVPGGVQPNVAQTAAGAAIAAVGVTGVLLAMDPTAQIARRRGLAILLVAVGIGGAGMTVSPPVAHAHDPGQGDEIVDVVLVAEVTGQAIAVEVVLASNERAGEPIRVMARRAGRTLTGPLVATSNGWTGEVDVDEDGRWFVYVEVRRGQQYVEAWIPVVAGADGITSKDTVLYVADIEGGVSASQAMAGVGLLSLVAVLLARVSVVVRATLGAASPPPGTL